mmetsp:Transcript_10267/g.23350  ORF Transcript_10267/g.23350 Transcript_10267/m.23350 type:complete len:136 (+) Transcript_10267:493-900(+)
MIAAAPSLPLPTFLLVVGSFLFVSTSRDYRATVAAASLEEQIAVNGNGRMSIANTTCGFFQQPLNHFVPRGRSPTYQERYCTYDGFVDESKSSNNGQHPRHGNSTVGDNVSPIFFYTGNESPLEQYINQVRCVAS